MTERISAGENANRLAAMGEEVIDGVLNGGTPTKRFAGDGFGEKLQVPIAADNERCCGDCVVSYFAKRIKLRIKAIVTNSNDGEPRI